MVAGLRKCACLRCEFLFRWTTSWKRMPLCSLCFKYLGLLGTGFYRRIDPLVRKTGIA